MLLKLQKNAEIIFTCVNVTKYSRKCGTDQIRSHVLTTAMNSPFTYISLLFPFEGHMLTNQKLDVWFALLLVVNYT